MTFLPEEIDSDGLVVDAISDQLLAIDFTQKLFLDSALTQVMKFIDFPAFRILSGM